MKTKAGVLLQDATGLWHYQFMVGAGHVKSAAMDALEHRIEPSWFWFNGTPAPIHLGDDVESLVKRWEEWREYDQKGRLLDKLLGLVPTIQ